MHRGRAPAAHGAQHHPRTNRRRRAGFTSARASSVAAVVAAAVAAGANGIPWRSPPGAARDNSRSERYGPARRGTGRSGPSHHPCSLAVARGFHFRLHEPDQKPPPAIQTPPEPVQQTSRLSCQCSQHIATLICRIADNADKVMAMIIVSGENILWPSIAGNGVLARHDVRATPVGSIDKPGHADCRCLERLARSSLQLQPFRPPRVES
jgi:hypothetical protein